MSADVAEATAIAVIYFAIVLFVAFVGAFTVVRGDAPRWLPTRRRYAPSVNRLFGWSNLLLGIAGLLMGVAAGTNIVNGAHSLVGAIMTVALIAVLAAVGLLFYGTWVRDHKPAEATKTK